MQRYRLLIMILVFATAGSLQAEVTKVFLPEDSIHTMPDQGVRFDYAGMSLDNFLTLHVVYPDSCRENNISGKVIVQFRVNIEGDIDTAFILGKVPIYKQALAREALRVVLLTSGKWLPATKQGIPVKTYAKIPIYFVLE